MFVFVEESAESVTAADLQLRDAVGIGDRVGERVQGPGVGDPAVGPVQNAGTSQVDFPVPGRPGAAYQIILDTDAADGAGADRSAKPGVDHL